ncbi:hypothetical protein AXF42_Ash020283 [Apostasia shenzhenica]|uniref:Uncharacterized protein n=1 Tax=Apostasia shenzhenica TaxID=1088818 RepID=A0A2H9ZSX0_9ASPA|nr:hypothetical protein AXF42_Ash020283 [Apostasia shenzhenica]
METSVRRRGASQQHFHGRRRPPLCRQVKRRLPVDVHRSCRLRPGIHEQSRRLDVPAARGVVQGSVPAVVLQATHVRRSDALEEVADDAVVAGPGGAVERGISSGVAVEQEVFEGYEGIDDGPVVAEGGGDVEDAVAFRRLAVEDSGVLVVERAQAKDIAGSQRRQVARIHAHGDGEKPGGLRV